VTVAEEPLPGPGQYRLQRQFDADVHAKSDAEEGTNVFRSQSKRINEASTGPQNIRPAPGQYDPQPMVARDMASTTAFRSSVPIAGNSQPARLSKEQELGVVQAQASGNVPGPGEYNYGATSFKMSQRRSPQFCDSGLDRFGRPGPGVSRRSTAPSITPGPGAYHREEAHDGALISSAVFMSSTARKGESGLLAPVPGPAYYTPAGAVDRKSYHLNAVQRWMPS